MQELLDKIREAFREFDANAMIAARGMRGKLVCAKRSRFATRDLDKLFREWRKISPKKR